MHRQTTSKAFLFHLFVSIEWKAVYLRMTLPCPYACRYQSQPASNVHSHPTTYCLASRPYKIERLNTRYQYCRKGFLNDISYE